jgi:hypothetical protein
MGGSVKAKGPTQFVTQADFAAEAKLSGPTEDKAYALHLTTIQRFTVQISIPKRAHKYIHPVWPSVERHTKFI